jgi:hypothetical protein
MCPQLGLRSDDGRTGPENPDPSAYLKRVAVQVFLGEERRLTFLSMDNEICLAWLAYTLQQLRQEGRTKAVGYLEAVQEEVVFESRDENISQGEQPEDALR